MSSAPAFLNIRRHLLIDACLALLQFSLCIRLQAEGEAAYADVQHVQQAHTTAASSDRQQAPSAAGMGTPAARLSAAHISTTPPHAAASAAARTPLPADVTRALLSQAETPASAAAQLSAQLAVSPSVLTPGVAQAMAEAGEAVAVAAALGGQESTANLDKIKAKLTVLKEHIHAKTKRMSVEKQRQIEGQIEKLEKSLAYVEKQRVSRVLGGSLFWGFGVTD
jgi:hypothetical protein